MKAMLAFLVAAIVGLVGFQLYSGKIPEFAPQPAAQAPLPLASPTTPSPFKCDGPASSENSKSSRNIVSRCSSSPITSGWTQVSKITLAPSKPICGLCRAGKS